MGLRTLSTGMHHRFRHPLRRVFLNAEASFSKFDPRRGVASGILPSEREVFWRDCTMDFRHCFKRQCIRFATQLDLRFRIDRATRNGFQKLPNWLTFQQRLVLKTSGWTMHRAVHAYTQNYDLLGTTHKRNGCMKTNFKAGCCAAKVNLGILN